jgi:hypothetical protein
MTCVSPLLLAVVLVAATPPPHSVTKVQVQNADNTPPITLQQQHSLENSFLQLREVLRNFVQTLYSPVCVKHGGLQGLPTFNNNGDALPAIVTCKDGYSKAVTKVE